MRKILDYDEAKLIYGPHAERIAEAIALAFSNFLRIINISTETNGYIEYTRTAKATLLHDLIKNSITDAFRGVEGVRTGTWNRIFGLKIGEDLFIRFKKFNADYSVAGIPTKQFKKYERQLLIKGLPEEPTFLIAGYIPSRTWTHIEGIFIACRLGNNIQWVEELMGGASAVQMALPFTNDPQPTGTRVKVKSPNESGNQQTGTDG